MLGALRNVSQRFFTARIEIIIRIGQNRFPVSCWNTEYIYLSSESREAEDMRHRIQVMDCFMNSPTVHWLIVNIPYEFFTVY